MLLFLPFRLHPISRAQPLIDCVYGDWPVAIDIDSVPPSPRLLSWCLSPVAVELGYDISTTSNGGARCVLLHTIPLPFTDGPDASSLPTTISNFRLDDRTTKSIPARNTILSNRNHGVKIELPIFSTGSGRESCWT